MKDLDNIREPGVLRFERDAVFVIGTNVINVHDEVPMMLRLLAALTIQVCLRQGKSQLGETDRVQGSKISNLNLVAGGS